jgi:hypothetical protein
MAGCGMTYTPSELGLTPSEQNRKGADEEEGINFGVALSVIEGLLKLADIGSIPSPPLPPPVALAGENRSGLSPKRVAANIIARQSEAGARLGPRDNGEDSISEKMEVIRIEEIMGEVSRNMRINIATPPGTAAVVQGANSGGPLVAYGATTAPGFGWGVPL